MSSKEAVADPIHGCSQLLHDMVGPGYFVMGCILYMGSWVQSTIATIYSICRTCVLYSNNIQVDKGI